MNKSLNICLLLLVLLLSFQSNAFSDGNSRALPKGNDQPAIHTNNNVPKKDYTDIDRHAENTPASVEKSINALVDYLIEPASDDFEKVRAIYYWISHNISYDTKSFFSGKYPPSDAKATFLRRSSVCQGYANLFQEMCRIAGTKAEVISGFSKGWGYKPGDKIDWTDSNHAWNAVEIGGNYYLIDSTWGAGSLSSSGKFEWKFTDYYFLTKPENFILDHYPEDDKWQLLDSIVSKQTFISYPKIYSTFFSYGLVLPDDCKYNFQTDGQTSITIITPPNIKFMAKLESAGGEIEQATFVDREKDKAIVRMRFPRKGAYQFTVYAKSDEEEGDEYNAILSYKVDANNPSEKLNFPKTYNTYDKNNVELYEPNTGFLNAGENYTFRIVVPGAIKVALVANENWTYFNNTDDRYELNTLVVRGTNKIYAKFPGQDNFWALVEYQGK